MEEKIGGRVDVQVDQWETEWVNECKKRQVDRWMDVQVDQWETGWVDGWKKRQMGEGNWKYVKNLICVMILYNLNIFFQNQYCDTTFELRLIYI